MSRLVFSFLICVFVTASFVDIYGYNDYDVREQNVMQKLLRILDNNEYKEKRRNIEDKFENWNGRWMPDRPGDPKPPPKILPMNQPQYEYESMIDFPHEMFMGHVSPECDDAKTNLTIDWDYSPSAYTCYGHNIIPNKITPKIYCENIPKTYKAAHKCMTHRIEYDDDIPLYGPHRPLWPVYGEYKYLPKQRWLHSLEPLALLSWGCRLTMSYVNPTVVSRFIQKRALRGPEKIATDGQFEVGLLSRSNIVTDETDSTLCPNT
ncbi:uncharacterized protein LOC105836185 isoform X2 [Monomorium pharaonis]|uniref:uncharacterized protein LOC105836185 isoform X2 n=1 Tax=Monomorium pharaonis TaxID=307658 RepID=UPI00102E12E7|nr:uncharacterized protein LOC105836185 isoform X2 [Monomorium pharaonis]